MVRPTRPHPHTMMWPSMLEILRSMRRLRVSSVSRPSTMDSRSTLRVYRTVPMPPRANTMVKARKPAVSSPRSPNPRVVTVLTVW
ncbi:hypothetical protein BH24ACT4_BH24ACT4_03540 [soil metagenome]